MIQTTIIPGFEAIAPRQKRGYRRFTKGDMQRIADLWLSGFGYKRIVKATGIPKMTVLRNLRKFKLTDPTRKSFNPRAGTGKSHDPLWRQVEAFNDSQRWLRRNENHWARHPAVRSWRKSWDRIKADPVLHRREVLRVCDAIVEKERTDPAFKLLRRLRRRLWLYAKHGLRQHMTDLIGCSRSEFKQHISKHFKKGMTWDNYGNGGWHLDHIKPCMAFDLLDPHQQAECFHFSNLRPVWARDNIAKSDRLKDGRRARDLDLQLGLRLPVT